MRNDFRWRRLVEQVPLKAIGMPMAIVLSGLGVAIAALLRVVIDPVLPTGFPYITFFPVIIVAAFLFGPLVGALTGAAAGLIAWYWFIPPDGFALTIGTAIALGFFLFIVTTDIALIHWMQRAAHHLKLERETSSRLAAMRELLFRELQHRVSNNLQVVAALLALQKRQVSDPAALLALDEAGRRLGLIGRISRQLYDPQGGGQGIGPFLQTLVSDVVESSGRDGISYSIAGGEMVEVAPDSAVALALAVTEAIANAIEHGFAGRAQGHVEVIIAAPRDRIQVEIADNGQGLPAGFAIGTGDSLGLRIATMLTAQIGGSFALSPTVDGTLARIDLPRVARNA